MKIRRATEADVPEMLALHRAAVQQTGASAYPPEVLEQWSPVPTPERISGFQRSIAAEEELVLVATDGDVIMGFGSVVPDQNELRAVYVHPDHGRKGVGDMIINALEEIARGQDAKELCLDSSFNAEAFYSNHGYNVVEYGEHKLRNGLKMPCVKMRKSLVL